MNTLPQLADLDLPVAPAVWPLVLAITLLILALLLLWWFIWQRKHSTLPTPVTHSALAVIQQIRQQWQLGAIDPREAAYRLATALRLGLNLSRLQADAPPPRLPAAQWRAALQRLDALRYPTQSGGDIDDGLFDLITGLLTAATVNTDTPC
ncbi:MAG: hypothetical protein HY940_10255 [Gammaproteobacteria bacterium]|nr:hypothetical protein [Gammaproteobacteria bacterium]